MRSDCAQIHQDILHSQAATHFQFERVGFFITDEKEHKKGQHIELNRVLSLKESKAKELLKK